MHKSLSCLALVLATTLAHADTPQSLSAQVGDIAFASADEDITLVPVNGSFSLGASTAGASAWPPPKTRIDRLSITCDGFADGKPLVLDHKAFERSTCDVGFAMGTKSMGGEPDAQYRLDKNSAENRFEITRAEGKVYEGTFKFQLKDAAGKSITVSNGHFKVEDRQL